MSWLSDLFKKKKRNQIVYQNYGTFRVPDEYYFLPYSGKAKIIYDVTRLLKIRRPPSSVEPTAGVIKQTDSATAQLATGVNKVTGVPGLAGVPGLGFSSTKTIAN